MQFFFLPIFFAALLGNKTIDMFHALDQGILSNYQIDQKTFIYNKKLFTIVTGNLAHLSTIGPLAYIGSLPTQREIIYIDPAHSPLLEKHYQEFKSGIFGDTLNILYALKTYLKNQVLTSSDLYSFFSEWIGSDNRTLDDFTLSTDGDYIPIISIEAFIEKKVGACRHMAFLSTYFLDRLIQEGFLSGTTYLVRDFISTERLTGGHAWSLFIDADKQGWHIDIHWDIIKNINDPLHFQTLCSLYGKTAMDYQVQRYQIY